jgi:hypothetical protein
MSSRVSGAELACLTKDGCDADDCGGASGVDLARSCGTGVETTGGEAIGGAETGGAETGGEETGGEETGGEETDSGTTGGGETCGAAFSCRVSARDTAAFACSIRLESNVPEG